MKDKGMVLSTENTLARVRVACLEACQGCPANSLCIGPKNATGILSVKNPIHAKAGDRVLISIPELSYSKALILLFGALLLAAVAGMGLGYWMTPFLPLSSSVSSLLGTLLGIVLAGTLLALRFKKITNESLYPEIIEILHKGDSYE